jgi:hypothetical protein
MERKLYGAALAAHNRKMERLAQASTPTTPTPTPTGTRRERRLTLQPPPAWQPPVGLDDLRRLTAEVDEFVSGWALGTRAAREAEQLYLAAGRPAPTVVAEPISAPRPRKTRDLRPGARVPGTAPEGARNERRARRPKPIETIIVSVEALRASTIAPPTPPKVRGDRSQPSPAPHKRRAPSPRRRPSGRPVVFTPPPPIGAARRAFLSWGEQLTALARCDIRGAESERQSALVLQVSAEQYRQSCQVELARLRAQLALTERDRQLAVLELTAAREEAPRAARLAAEQRFKTLVAAARDSTGAWREAYLDAAVLEPPRPEDFETGRLTAARDNLATVLGRISALQKQISNITGSAIAAKSYRDAAKRHAVEQARVLRARSIRSDLLREEADRMCGLGVGVTPLRADSRGRVPAPAKAAA